MARANLTTAVVAGVAILAATATYLIKGTVPEVLTILATTTVGGYLGITVPAPAAETAPPSN